MKKGKMFVVIVFGLIFIATVGAFGYNQYAGIPNKPQEIKVAGFTAGASVHDPSIFSTGDGSYYIFGSHMEGASSKDLRNWTSFASGVNGNNPLFDNLFTDYKAFDYVGKNMDGGYSVWAPHVIYNIAMEKYVMYFCTSSSYVKSTLCFATADNIEGPYTYQDTLLYSGFTYKDVEQTDVSKYVADVKSAGYFSGAKYNNSQWPNAIDPTAFYDAQGRMWMVYGSWSGGMFILELDETTGLPIHPEEDEATATDAYFGKNLMGGFHNSIEGPFVLYDEKSEYYYLYVSYGALTREGGYQIRAYRSKNPDGPYEDAAGQTMGAVVDHSKYGVKMLGNYTLPSLDKAYMAPGHNSAFIDEDGKMFLVYHTRFDNGSERHEPRVHQMFVNKAGWPVAAPFAYDGETISETGYKTKDIIGTYYFLNHGTEIGKSINEPIQIELKKNGTLIGDKISGTWEAQENSSLMSIQWDGVTYEGVFLQMNDESGTPVMTFTCIGDNNQSVWGVKY